MSCRCTVATSRGVVAENHLPMVSIGLPVYNGENYLSQAISALLAQTYTDFELIICDNASTDSTQSIAERYVSLDSRVKYVRHPRNNGLIWNFNWVFSHAIGRYFKWAAHDDLVSTEFLADCVEQMETDKSLVACCPSAEVIDEKGFRLVSPDNDAPVVRKQDPLGGTRLIDKPGDVRGLDDDFVHRRFRGVLLESARCYEEYGLLRTEIIREMAPRGYYPGSEKVFLAELSLLGPIKVLQQTGIYIRLHDQRLSAKNTLEEREQLYLAPRAKKDNMHLSPKIRSAWGYGSLIWKYPMTWRERSGCVVTFVQFLFQFSKWRAILNNNFRGIETPVSAKLMIRGPLVSASNNANKLTEVTPSSSAAVQNNELD